MKNKTRKFTILHSNDMHGDFLAEVDEKSNKLIGGLAYLSGYLNKVRQEEKNVIYAIAGDMVQGSLIDSEYQGVSTIEIMNYLSPDVVTLGNHELDYGLAHLLFLEKVANFPIINANLYMKKYGKRLMNPYRIIEMDGFKILFIGITTEKVMDVLALDQLIGTFVSIEDAAEEIGKICNAYKHDDIDLTVALTHVGIETDVELAKLLQPEWGVDMILGGHTHTFLEEPLLVNDILIAQAGTGTDQIGRFDLVVDDATNSIVKWDWSLIPINESSAPVDEQLKQFIHEYKDKVDEKYNGMVTHFLEKLTHPTRVEETTLGNMFADAMQQATLSDVMLVGSGSIRKKQLGPVVTLGDLKACFPYDDTLMMFTVDGSVLKRIFSHIMRIENRDGEGENYQVNHQVKAIYKDQHKRLESLSISNQAVLDHQHYTLAMQGYHYKNCKANLNVNEAELIKLAPLRVVATSAYQVLEEYLRTQNNATRTIEGRLLYQ